MLTLDEIWGKFPTMKYGDESWPQFWMCARRNRHSIDSVRSFVDGKKAEPRLAQVASAGVAPGALPSTVDSTPVATNVDGMPSATSSAAPEPKEKAVTRRELLLEARRRGIKLLPGTPTIELLSILKEETPSLTMSFSASNASTGLTKTDKDPPQMPKSSVKTTFLPSLNLDAMSRRELLLEARRRGIKIEPKTPRESIISLLK